MKPFRNTILAIIIEDLRNVAKLIGNISIFLGVMNYVGFIELNVNFPEQGLRLACVGLMMFTLSFAFEWIYHFFKRRHEAK